MDTNTRTRTSPLPVHEESHLVKSPSLVNRILTNRALATRLGLAVVVVVLLVTVGVLVFQHRSTTANDQLAAAMETFDTPISTPEQPLPPGTKSFASLEERAKASNSQFAAIADSYGMTDAGRNALYLQGVTAMQMGQNSTAETLLKKSADGWNHDIATLSQMALAGLYRSTGREGQAIEIYQKIAAKPSILVPAGLAQLTLAELYEGDGKADQAKKIYAQIKDKAPKSASADIATQRLAGPPAAR